MDAHPHPPEIPLVVSSLGPPDFMTSPVRLSRGLYADLDLTPTHAPPWQTARSLSLARCAAARMRVPSARCLSHESAALVHGLAVRAWEPDVSVVVPGKPHRPTSTWNAVAGRRPGVLLRRRALRLEDEQITAVAGLPITTLMRTALDCAFDLPVRDSICIVDSALRALIRPGRRRQEDAEQRAAELRLDLLAMAKKRTARAGARRARAVISIASPLAESPGESILRCLVLALGLPTPVLQTAIPLKDLGTEAFPDIAWPEFKIYLEFDGRLKYASEADLWREKQRRDALARLGWRCEHITWDDLRHPDRLRTRLLALFPPEVLRTMRPVLVLWP